MSSLLRVAFGIFDDHQFDRVVDVVSEDEYLVSGVVEPLRRVAT